MSTGPIFLSHAGADSAIARELAAALTAAGLEVWLDVEVQAGDRWNEELERALEQARAMVVWVGSLGIRNWVDREVRVGLDRSTTEKGFRLIPVLGPGASLDALPLFLRQHQCADMRGGMTPESVQALAGILRAPAVGEPKRTSDEPPFRGLLSFEREHSWLFFGRDGEVQALLERLAAAPFLTVMGPSGSGKSSLVKAGLIPALFRGRFLLRSQWQRSWQVAVFRPGNSPFDEMAEALPQLKPGLEAAERSRFIGETKRQLKQGPEGLKTAIAAVAKPPGERPRVLLVVDQFEEIFAPTGDPAERSRYIDCLMQTCNCDSSVPVHVLVVLRADFYSRCYEHPQLLDRVTRNQYAVKRIDAEQLRAVIEKPLAFAGARAEPGLVEAILAEAGDEPGALPLLEHALEQLWEQRRRGNDLLTNAAYQEIGRLRGALARHARAVYEAFDKEDREIVRKVFLNLTQLADDAEDTRRRVPMSHLQRLSSVPEDVSRVVKVLSDERLVTTGGGEERVFVEVAHEALIREWPLLRGWLQESRATLRLKQKLVEAAAEWEEVGRDTNALLRGKRLAEAEAWFEPLLGELSDSATAFMEASLAWRVQEEREAKERREREVRLQRNLLKLAAIMVALLAALAFYLQHQWKVSESRSLAAAAGANLEETIRAYRIHPTPEATAAISRALFPRRSVLQHDGKVLKAEFSPDGERLLVLGADRMVQVWNAASGSLLQTVPLAQGQLVEVSPDGSLVAKPRVDGNTEIREAATGRLVVLLSGHTQMVEHAVFSPDGRRVVTASHDFTAAEWEVASGRRVAIFRGYARPVNRAGFSPDGRRIVTVSYDNTARLWEAGTGRELGTLSGHRNARFGSRVLSRRRIIATASWDGSVRLWDGSTGVPLATALEIPVRVHRVAYLTQRRRAGGSGCG